MISARCDVTYRRVPEGSKTTPQTSEPACCEPREAQQRRHEPVGADDADLEVAAVLAHEDVAGRADRDVVDRVERGGGRQRGVVEDLDRLGARGVRPDLLVALGREVDDAARVPEALAAVELRHRGTCWRVGVPVCAVVGSGTTCHVTDRSSATLGDLERARRQVRVGRRGEAVEPAGRMVLGQVDPLPDAVDGCGLVREDAEGRDEPARPACPRGRTPRSCPLPSSSPDSHVPHGVGPPAQFDEVPPRMRYAFVIVPSAANRVADVPPPTAAADSELVTRIQPPSRVLNVACPSG